MKFLIFSLLFFQINPLQAKCLILTSSGSAALEQQDGLFQILKNLEACPQDVFQLKSLLTHRNLIVSPSMVANRGRNNPHLGSFSFFEVVKGNLSLEGGRSLPIQDGDFFFGHFTGKSNNTIDLDQNSNPRSLMIELIVWDVSKKLYNFYELIGQGTHAQWFYRGDTKDIIQDNQLLHRSHPPQFGKTLRCSGCHTSGGPIMKELAAPHNDWWTKARPLVFGGAKLSQNIMAWLNQIQDASTFSQSVQRGIQKLQVSPTYQRLISSRSLQEQLRPLFCDVEINIISSSVTSDTQSGTFDVSSEAFINPFFGKMNLRFSRAQYQQGLQKFQVHFPENNLQDADHIWLTPVKSVSDLIAIQMLIKKGVIDLDFAYDVLAIDAKTNLFSQSRCQLLQLVPNALTANWKSQFLFNLKSSQNPMAHELVLNISHPSRVPQWYQAHVAQYLKGLQQKGLGSENFTQLFKNRQSVFEADISKNPLGQILEPGFRVIFPLNSITR